MDKAGVRPSKNYKDLVVKASGYENLPFGEKDCRNYINKVRNKLLGEGDAEALRNYFMRMQENDSFFYVIDLDEESRLRNVFWANAQSRAAYESFEDIITFDTTYLTNKYKMPFASFVRVNHYGQSVLFGCGLLSNENIDTFVWLFEAWLKCMSRRAPNAIITDQDRAMQAAIARVFPRAKHRFCLWHIMSKFPHKLGSHSQYENFKGALLNCVYDSLNYDEFEKRWQQVVESYNLKENAWFCQLYGEQYQWIPAYVKDTFWAGMSTTQRSESMNAFF
ncbi:protein FAR-RED IMPAIRED RESPONSE 1-like [Corylus avellana]|uniref:protein FAR-RED IMPAIRED RESPONSE 1-like n=1 Tax=Corylus avellana TaxID=13451 RepID=UPI00286B814F|nr:protein FAR-RED IMPAIRED RESPONSE 1-like [Corylus avellana]